MKMSFRLNRLALTMAALVLCAPAQAADTRAAETRARSHIVNQPGASLHAPGHEYTVRDVIVDPDGAQHVRFERRFRGMRVVGGDMVVHSNGRGIFQGVSKTLSRPIDVPARAAVTPADAQRAALGSRPGYAAGTRVELLVYAREELPVLAYDVEVLGTQADGTPSELHVIIDARTGRELDAWDDIHTGASPGTGKGFFSGTVVLTTNSLSTGYELRDPSRGNQATFDMQNKQSGSGVIFKDTDNVWGSGSLIDRATVGVDAQYGTAVTWDYFKLVHGRNGIRNDGVGARNRVHYARNYSNAFWSGSCFCMTYGDGDGVTFNPFDSLDVAGHEMTHGVTSATANLIYSGESGGLNEATSDIFGTAVEFHAANAIDQGDYLIGEMILKTAGRYLRTMIQPSDDGRSADCWFSTLGSLDVHYSSGVANHFFYLLAEGSASSKTCKAGDTRVASGGPVVAGIGRDKAEKIWYRALTVHMTSSTNYAGARAATLLAANYLYGAGSVEATAVAAAWSAVLVN